MSIVATTDGSELSLQVLPHAARLSAATGRPLTVVRALNPAIDLGGAFAPDVATASARVAREWRGWITARLREAGIAAAADVLVLEHGEDTVSGVARFARARGALALAMHSRGAGAVRHAVLGSTVMNAVGRARLPVLVTGAHAGPAATAGAPYRLVVASDLSAASQDVFAPLGALIAGGSVTVTVVTACRPGEEPEAGRLDALAARLSAGVAVTARVEHQREGEDAAAALVRVAAGADAIALSTHGHSALRHLFAGSVALALLQHGATPVLLVRGE